MTTTPDNAATTWRDLADQLTPEQVAYLELSECHPVPMADGTFDPERERCGHLFGAREMAAQNLAAMLYQHIPTAAGAEDIGPWQQFDDDGSWSRVWWGVRRLVPIASAGTHDFEVFVQGTQWSDGREQSGIVLDGSGDSMTAAEVRQLVAALLDAADQLDRLEG